MCDYIFKIISFVSPLYNTYKRQDREIPKRNSAIILYATIKHKFVLLLSKRIKKIQEWLKARLPEKNSKLRLWNARKLKKGNRKSECVSYMYLELDGINSAN